MGFSAEFLADNNKNLILKAIREKGPISRADISRFLDISKPAVSKNVLELLDAQIIREIGQGNNSMGKKSILLAFNRAKAFAIGIDIGNFKIRAGLSDLSGNILAFEEEDIHCEVDGEKILQIADNTIKKICIRVTFSLIASINSYTIFANSCRVGALAVSQLRVTSQSSH